MATGKGKGGDKKPFKSVKLGMKTEGTNVAPAPKGKGKVKTGTDLRQK